MTLRKKQQEIRRLINAFEGEADKFHDFTFSIYEITQQSTNSNRKFRNPNHAIMLWQYYGKVRSDGDDTKKLLSNLQDSDLKWGVRGAEFSLYGVVEGDACPLFLRMASRAGSLFDDNEVSLLKNRLKAQLLEVREKLEKGEKLVISTNDNPVAIWLNYLLYHLSIANPGRENIEQIEPDPFTLSLLALERLLEEPSVSKSDRSTSNIRNLHFSVAVSFPGTVRSYVADVVQALRPKLPEDKVFYDFDYQSQLACPSLDTLLQDIYIRRSDLLVVFLEKEYATRDWCGIEWRAIREIIKSRQDEKVMLVRFDQTKIDGVFSTDGYIDANKTPPARLAQFIFERLNAIGT